MNPRDREIRKGLLDDAQYLVRKLGVSPEDALDKVLTGWSNVPPDKKEREAFLSSYLDTRLVSCGLTSQQVAEVTDLMRLCYERGESDEQTLKALDRINRDPQIGSVLVQIFPVLEFEFALSKLTARAMVELGVDRKADLPKSIRTILDEMWDKSQNLLKDIHPLEGKRERKLTKKRKPRKQS